MTGADVLQALAAACDRDPSDDALNPAVHPGRIGRLLGDKDGRRAAARLRKLRSAGLASSGPAARRLKSGRIKRYSYDVWSPTERGREVDATLDRIVAARGGTFRPWSEAGIDFREAFALR